jgi:hypothetical protein
MSLPSEVADNSVSEGNKTSFPAVNDPSLASQGGIVPSNGDRQEVSGQHEKRDVQTVDDTGSRTDPGESPFKRRRIDEPTETTAAGTGKTVSRRKGMAPVRQE